MAILLNGPKTLHRVVVIFKTHVKKLYIVLKIVPVKYLYLQNIVVMWK